MNNDSNHGKRTKIQTEESVFEKDTHKHHDVNCLQISQFLLLLLLFRCKCVRLVNIGIILAMTTKSSIKYASIKNVETTRKSSRKIGDTEFKMTPKISEKLSSATSTAVTTKTNRRSQSLDRLDENSGDSRTERRNRRQFMHLVGKRAHNGFQRKNK